MITTDIPKRISAQACPLCGMKQDVIINGMVTEGDKTYTLNDHGYSFCNCNNIFFTDWSNIKLEAYDQAYEERYNNDQVKECLETYAKAYFKTIKESVAGDIFLEIGCVNPTLLDKAVEHGFKAIGLDIIEHSFPPHEMLKDNFEELENPEPMVDVIWASHIFEHFKDPIQAGRKCYDLLNDNGILFVAMPDPFMIDWKQPYTWGHWHINEHHILWDMDSFCAAMEKLGFKTIFKHRNTNISFVCVADYHVMLQKVKQ